MANRSDKKEISINFGGIGLILLIILCWGKPDILDGIIKKLNEPSAPCSTTQN